MQSTIKMAAKSPIHSLTAKYDPLAEKSPARPHGSRGSRAQLREITSLSSRYYSNLPKTDRSD